MGAVGVSEYEGVTSPAYDILKPIQPLCPRYYHHLFRTKLYLQQFKQRSRGIMDMRLRLYFDQLGQIPVLVPPVNEQEEIVAYIVEATGDLEKTIETTHREISLLREYRTRLIADVVTGKLDVREAAAKLPDVELDEDSFVLDTLEDENASGEEFSDLMEETDED
jgi:type I restriction enzyme S subunit